MNSIKVKNLFTDGKLLQNQELFIDQGKIISLSATEGPFDFENISAAFFDTHINGGKDLYLTQSVSEEAIEDIFTASVATGTFYALPCLITSAHNNIIRGLKLIKDYMARFPEKGVLGLHLEGPFLNPKKRGAHLAKYVRKPTDEELQEIISFGPEVIKIWTLAPEQFEASQLQMIQDAGITVSLGHSDATYEQAKMAFDSGINLVTHLYNAMSGLHHRMPGLVGATLAHPKVWAPIILDGKHCHIGSALAAYNAKPDHLFLISDALFLGKQKEYFQWEEFDARLVNCEYVNSEGNLAGSAISMGDAVKNAVEILKIPIETAIDMATLRPAKAVNLEQQIGKIAPGYPAVFTSFSNDLNNFEVLNFQ